MEQLMETLFRKGRCRAWGRKSLMLFFCFMRRPVHKVRILAPGSLPLKRCRGRAASRDKISPTCLPVSGASEALRQIASVRIYKFRNPACSDSLYLILLFLRFYKHSNITFCINMDSIPAFMEIKSLK